MPDLFPGFAAARWPRPADPRAADRERERWLAAAQAVTPEIAALGRTLADEAAPAFDAILGNSTFLTHCLQREPAFACALLR